MHALSTVAPVGGQGRSFAYAATGNLLGVAAGTGLAGVVAEAVGVLPVLLLAAGSAATATAVACRPLPDAVRAEGPGPVRQAGAVGPVGEVEPVGGRRAGVPGGGDRRLTRPGCCGADTCAAWTGRSRGYTPFASGRERLVGRTP